MPDPIPGATPEDEVNQDSESLILKDLEKSETEKYTYPESKTLKHFWESLISGHWQPLSLPEAEETVDQIVRENSPIIELTEEEKANIKYAFLSYILNRSNEYLLPALAEDNKVALFDPTKFSLGSLPSSIEEMIAGEQNLYLLPLPDKFTSKQEENFYKVNLPQLSKQERINVLSNPEIFNILRYKSSDAASLGLRPLFVGENRDSYGIEQEEFDEVMKTIRLKTGRQKLKMLDVGGGNGEALHEAKQHDSDIETYNLASNEQPAMFPVDHFMLLPAELMPKELEEQIDYVVSNQAFRYFTYPDIALKNTIKALSVGGMANIAFDRDRSPLYEIKGYKEGEAELQTRLKKLFKDIIKLEDEGIIETDIREVDKINPDRYWRRIRIVKQQSTKGTEI